LASIRVSWGWTIKGLKLWSSKGSSIIQNKLDSRANKNPDLLPREDNKRKKPATQKAKSDKVKIPLRKKGGQRDFPFQDPEPGKKPGSAEKIFLGLTKNTGDKKEKEN